MGVDVGNVGLTYPLELMEELPWVRIGTEEEGAEVTVDLAAPVPTFLREEVEAEEDGDAAAAGCGQGGAATESTLLLVPRSAVWKVDRKSSMLISDTGCTVTEGAGE